MFFKISMAAGVVKSIGVSNYNVYHLEQLLQHANVTPAVLQVMTRFSDSTSLIIRFLKQYAFHTKILKDVFSKSMQG